MGFFDKLKGMVGIGNPKLEITLDSPQVKRGDYLTGNANIKGGQRETPVAALIISLVSKESSLDKDGKKINDENSVKEERFDCGNMVIKPGEEKSIKFRFQIPSNIDPTTSNTTWSADFSIDIPGWDSNEKKDITILEQKGEEFNEYEATRTEEEAEEYEALGGPTGHFKLGYKHTFRHSSVKGDFRIFPLKDGGFANTWKQETIVRNKDFSVRYPLAEWGRWAALSPDGSKLFMLSQYQKGITLINPVTGEVLLEKNLENWSAYATWTNDGNFIVLDEEEHLLVLDGNLNVVCRSKDVPTEYKYVGMSVAIPGSSTKVYVSNSSGDSIHEYDAQSNSFGNAVTFEMGPGDMCLSPDQSQLLVYMGSELHILDSKTLKEISSFPYPGMEGVKYFEEGDDEEKETHFVEIFNFSPDGKRIMLIEGAGTLMLVDLKGKVLKEIDRKLANFVEHFVFIDNNTVALLQNDGMFKVLDFANGKVLFEENDLELDLDSE